MGVFITAAEIHWRLILVLTIWKASFVENFEHESHKYGNVVHNYLPNGYKWPNATVIYQIDGQFIHSELQAIKQAMDHISYVSCVRFKKRTDEVGYVRITSEANGCWADTGRSSQRTQLNLGPGCFATNGTTLHEFMHTLGFLHQHTRPDRDRYVRIWYENIIQSPDILFNFEIIDPWTDSAFPLPYDFDSIMHYGSSMYSRAPDQLVTIASRNPWVTAIGQRDHLSELDIIAINFLYCV